LADPAPLPDTAERALAAIVGVLTDIQLAVLATASLIQVLTGPNLVDLMTLTLALTPSLVRLVRRGRRVDGFWGWAQAALDVVTAVAVLATIGSDSLVLVFIATGIALCGLERGLVGALLSTGVLAGVHLLAVAGLTADPGPSAGLLVVVVRVGLLAVAAVGSLRLREVILQREQLSRAYLALEQRRLQEVERTRLAREMHDSLAKSLHGVRLIAGNLATRLESEGHPLSGQAELLAASVQHGLAEARRIIHDLRETPIGSLYEHLDRTTSAWSAAHGIESDLVLPPGEPELPLAVREELAKSVAELLENVARHAGAHRVTVTLSLGDGDLALTVVDDGRGMPAPDLHALYRAGHYGLVGVSERMARIKGLLEVSSGPGGGTTVSLRVMPSSTVPDADGTDGGTTGVVPAGGDPALLEAASVVALAARRPGRRTGGRRGACRG
jgi:signal transduction histidine kinase